MDSVARYLCEDTALVSLVLSRNRIGEQGAISLSEGLKSNATLSHLNVACNEIGSAGMGAILMAAQSPRCALRELHVWKNLIGDPVAQSLSHFLQQASTITLINMDRNELSDSGVAELCGYLSKEGGQLLSTERPQPLTLQLNRNFLGKPSVEQLHTVCASLQVRVVAVNQQLRSSSSGTDPPLDGRTPRMRRIADMLASRSKQDSKMGTGGLRPSDASSTPTITPSSTAAAFLLPLPPKSGGSDGLQILGGLSPIPPPATVSDSQPSRIGGRDVASAGSSPSHSPEQYSSDSAQDFPPAVPLRGVREQDGGRFPLRSSGLWEAVDRRGSRDDEDSDEVGKVLRPASLESGLNSSADSSVSQVERFRLWNSRLTEKSREEEYLRTELISEVERLGELCEHQEMKIQELCALLEEGRQSQDALVEQFREKSQRELQHVQETCEAKVRDLESVVKELSQKLEAALYQAHLFEDQSQRWQAELQHQQRNHEEERRMQQDALLRTSQEAAQWMQISNLSTSLSHFASLQQDDLDQAQDRVQVMSQEREHILSRMEELEGKLSEREAVIHHLRKSNRAIVEEVERRVSGRRQRELAKTRGTIQQVRSVSDRMKQRFAELKTEFEGVDGC
mgnify:FL=1